MAGTLYLIATPIGHPDDLGSRARGILERVALVAAEDTRVAKTLYRRLGCRPPRLISYHDHNEQQRAPRLVELLKAGTEVALVADAGTPLVSDPGFRLVCAAIEAEIHVEAVPGPCAAVAALTVSGLPPDRFVFLGFLPRAEGRRRSAVREVSGERGTLVLYVAPHRVRATLELLAEELGERRAALAVNLTKPDQQVVRGTLSEISGALADAPRGEMTLVVEGRGREAAEVDERVEQLVVGLARRGVAPAVLRDVVSEAFGVPRRTIYQAALAAGGTPPRSR